LHRASTKRRRAVLFPDHGVCADRAVNVFEVLLAEISELNANSAYDTFIGRRGNADAAGFCDTFKPRRNIHAVAEDIMWLDNYVADIYADTESDTGIFRVGGCKFFDASLKLHSGSDRFNRVWKFCQKPVAGMLDDAAAVLRDRGRDPVSK
jgi:hypothetical protein